MKMTACLFQSERNVPFSLAHPPTADYIYIYLIYKYLNIFTLPKCGANVLIISIQPWACVCCLLNVIWDTGTTPADVTCLFCLCHKQPVCSFANVI